MFYIQCYKDFIMLKNIIILVVIIIGGYMVYTNYMQNKEIVVIEEDMNIPVNPDDVVAE